MCPDLGQTNGGRRRCFPRAIEGKHAAVSVVSAALHPHRCAGRPLGPPAARGAFDDPASPSHGQLPLLGRCIRAVLIVALATSKWFAALALALVELTATIAIAIACLLECDPSGAVGLGPRSSTAFAGVNGAGLRCLSCMRLAGTEIIRC